MGGAQAIAAFAYGTKTVPRADRIVGPGNIYVAAAKKLLAGEVGIDFVAGPTEILIIAAEGDPAFLAADMLAQAEHDVDASAILLTTSKRLAAAGSEGNRAPTLDTRHRAVARKAIDKNSAISHRAIRSTKPSNSPTPSPRSTSASTTKLFPEDPPRRQHLHRTVQSRSRGRLRRRSQPRAAHQRRSASARRTLRRRLRQGDLGPATRRPRSAQTRPAITTLARAEGLEAHARSVEVRLAH